MWFDSTKCQIERSRCVFYCDQNDCGTADTSIVWYTVHLARSGKVQFLVDCSVSLAMYNKKEKLGKKCEFRIWVQPEESMLTPSE